MSETQSLIPVESVNAAVVFGAVMLLGAYFGRKRKGR